MGRWVLPEWGCWTQGPCFCKSSVMVWMLASNWTKGYGVPKYFQTVPSQIFSCFHQEAMLKP